MRSFIPILRGLLVLIAMICWACSDDRCDQVVVYRIDPTHFCYMLPENAHGLRACREQAEKGVSFSCIASHGGDVYIGQHNAAASLEGEHWRFGSSLSQEEQSLCTRALAQLGLPLGAPSCSITDAE